MNRPSAVALTLEEYSKKRTHTGRNINDLGGRLTDFRETLETQDANTKNIPKQLVDGLRNSEEI